MNILTTDILPHTNEINQEYIPNIVEGTNPTYSPQIISDNNNGFTSQANDDVPTKKNITPIYITNNSNNSMPNTSSEPLVRPQKKTNKKIMQKIAAQKEIFQ